MRISDWSLDGCSSDLWTLERLGYVASNGRFFMLRPKVVSLGSAFLDSGRIEEVIQPILREIVAESGDSASLGVLEDKDVLYVANFSARRFVRKIGRASCRERVCQYV